MCAATQPLGAVRVVSCPAPPRHHRFGGYTVVSALARGGMAGVYLAVDAAGDRVALKLLNPRLAQCEELVERLLAEHALASRTDHPGVVEIRGAAWTADRVPYLVMEYLQGETLGAIADREPLDLRAILAICAQAAAALAALHAAGVIHCDVKHDNLFVLDEDTAAGPRVKVIDFGVSRLIDEPPRADPSVAGTPWCIAPEQWRGRPATASDVYALGCLLYELTTGHPPFDGSLSELIAGHLGHRPSRPSWLRPMPLALDRLILRSLAKQADDRPTMHEVAIELASLADAARGAPGAGQPGRPARDRDRLGSAT